LFLKSYKKCEVGLVYSTFWIMTLSKLLFVIIFRLLLLQLVSW